MKHCNTCNEKQSPADFSPDVRNDDGLQGKCKECVSKYAAARRAKRASEGQAHAIEGKHCHSCNQYKAADQYHSDPGGKGGLQASCALCARGRQLLRKYGITLADYDAMYAEQGGECAICETVETDVVKGRFHVDHCHETGKVRGLLCYHCNMVLGYAKDDTAALAAAINYLEANT
jgi:hypothetical protein